MEYQVTFDVQHWVDPSLKNKTKQNITKQTKHAPLWKKRLAFVKRFPDHYNLLYFFILNLPNLLVPFQ